MTVKTASLSAKRPTRKRAASDVAALVLRKPADESAIRPLAEQLNGLPVPGLRLTEAEYDAWCDSDVNAEWVDGEIILMPPAAVRPLNVFEREIESITFSAAWR